MAEFDMGLVQRGARKLRHRSEKKEYWHRLYVLGLRYLLRLNPFCRRCGKRMATEGHHHFLQSGALILLFSPICYECHREIHANHNRAREEGWLF
jgi:hypothetical protein